MELCSRYQKGLSNALPDGNAGSSLLFWFIIIGTFSREPLQQFFLDFLHKGLSLLGQENHAAVFYKKKSSFLIRNFELDRAVFRFFGHLLQLHIMVAFDGLSTTTCGSGTHKNHFSHSLSFFSTIQKNPKKNYLGP